MKKQASILMMETFVKYINDKNYINQDLQIIKKAIRIIKQLYNSAKIKRKKKFENF